jgi:nucleotide-binding universal stress UspA family protein
LILLYDSLSDIPGKGVFQGYPAEARLPLPPKGVACSRSPVRRSPSIEGRTSREEAYAERVLGVVSAAAKFPGVPCKRLHVEHEQHYQGIVDAASARKCDLIAIASHGVVVSPR